MLHALLLEVWDRRIRIYSRTSAKLLWILRGPNEDSITSLDWAVGDDDLVNAAVLAAGSRVMGRLLFGEHEKSVRVRM